MTESVPPSSRRILVAGCGYVGTELARRLADDGHAVWGLRRSGGDLPTGVRSLRGDLTDPATLTDLPAELDAVVYAASPDASEDEAYRRTYVEGPRVLLDALDAPPRRVVLVTSTAVWGGVDDGREVDEDTPPEPGGFRGERLLEGERAVGERVARPIALRLGGIYGPGRTRLIDRVRSGEARCPEEPRYTNRIHRDDAAAAIAHLLGLDAPQDVWIGVDREPADLCDVLTWMAERLRVEPPSRSRDADDPRHDAQGVTSRRQGQGKRCSSERLATSGFRFRFPTFREGYESMLEGAPPTTRIHS